MGDIGYMQFDYELWYTLHNECVNKVMRLCDLQGDNENSVKCNSALCVMNNAMQDIKEYFVKNIKSPAELCFLIRNIDVIITSILDINNILLGVGLSRSDKAIEKCFTDKSIICDFRTLRSLILAHPVDTRYPNDRGESVTVYLEDILPYSPVIHSLTVKTTADYVKRMCNPESHESFFEPLSIDADIVPVISIIIDSIDKLNREINAKIQIHEKNLIQQKLIIEKDTIQSYVKSLDKELEKRYPTAIENVELSDGTTMHNSIIYSCLKFYDTNFMAETQEQYKIFLKYIENELYKIEQDLQQMEFNEDKYFLLLYNSEFAPKLNYEKQKMDYLKNSDMRSYTDDYIGEDTPSNIMWGIRCFRRLIPYINEFIPVDTSVSDKGLYCQYVAAEYLSNIKR